MKTNFLKHICWNFLSALLKNTNTKLNSLSLQNAFVLQINSFQIIHRPIENQNTSEYHHTVKAQPSEPVAPELFIIYNRKKLLYRRETIGSFCNPYIGHVTCKKSE